MDTNTTNFSLDTKNGIPNSALGGTSTPGGVLSYRNKLQDKYDSQYTDYLNEQKPLQDQLLSATQFSPEYINALDTQRKNTQGYIQGTLDIRNKPVSLEFQTGQQQQLDLQNKFNEMANSQNLGLQEAIRKNNIDTTQTAIGLNQQNYQNRFGATQAGINADVQQQQLGISQQQLGISQQQANQGRYEYQQIIDPTTGFPKIVTIDKQTGQPVGSLGANGTLTGGNGNTAQVNGAGTAAVNVMKSLGVQADLPLSQVLQQFGTDPIVNAIIQNEGGSPKGVLNNPGNIKFKGLPGQVDSGVKASDGGTFASYTSPEAGKSAIAALVTNAAMGKSSSYGASPSVTSFMNKYTNTYPTSNSGINSSNNISQNAGGNQYQGVIDSAPAVIRNAIKQLPDGTPYIDAGQISGANFMTVAQAFSGQNGIRLISADDAKAIDSAKQAIANLQGQATLFAQLAPQSAAGKFGANIADPIKQLLNTDKGSLLKTYNQNRDFLLQQIRTLAGSSPRLNSNELNLAANSAPTLSEFSKDSLKDGINKVALTQFYIDNAIRSLAPNYVGTPININGSYVVRGSNGMTYTFQSNHTAMKFLQADSTNRK